MDTCEPFWLRLLYFPAQLSPGDLFNDRCSRSELDWPAMVRHVPGRGEWVRGGGRRENEDTKQYLERSGGRLNLFQLTVVWLAPSSLSSCVVVSSCSAIETYEEKPRRKNNNKKSVSVRMMRGRAEQGVFIQASSICRLMSRNVLTLNKQEQPSATTRTNCFSWYSGNILVQW